MAKHKRPKLVRSWCQLHRRHIAFETLNPSWIDAIECPLCRRDWPVMSIGKEWLTGDLRAEAVVWNHKP